MNKQKFNSYNFNRNKELLKNPEFYWIDKVVGSSNLKDVEVTEELINKACEQLRSALTEYAGQKFGGDTLIITKENVNQNLIYKYASSAKKIEVNVEPTKELASKLLGSATYCVLRSDFDLTLLDSTEDVWLCKMDTDKSMEWKLIETSSVDEIKEILEQDPDNSEGTYAVAVVPDKTLIDNGKRTKLANYLRKIYGYKEVVSTKKSKLLAKITSNFSKPLTDNEIAQLYGVDIDNFKF